MMSRKKLGTPLEAKLAELMRLLGIDQKQELAEHLEVSPTAILHWENGRSQPSAETYIRMATLARDKSPMLVRWFLEQIRIGDSLLRLIVPAYEKSAKQFEKRLRDWSEKKLKGLVPVPLIEELGDGDHASVLSRVRAATSEGAEACVPFPMALVSAPQSTICLRAPDDCMRPIFRRGDFVAVDISTAIGPKVSEVLRADKFFIDNPVVAAYYKPEARERSGLREGLHLRDSRLSEWPNLHLTTELGDWLESTPGYFVRRDRTNEREKSESRRVIITSDVEQVKAEIQNFESLIVTAKAEWTILGKIVGWLGRSSP